MNTGACWRPIARRHETCHPLMFRSGPARIEKRHQVSRLDPVRPPSYAGIALAHKELPVIWTWFVPGVVLLGLVIFVHELGHFLVAKWRGVRVLKFSLGFGPAIVQWTHGETQYRLSWIPLGGYVQMAGDSPAEDGTMPNRPDEFLSHPWFGRLLIAAAGPAANLLTA